MTTRTAMWLCVLLSLSGCLATTHEDPSDVGSDSLGLDNASDAANTKQDSAPTKNEPVANCSSPADSPPKPEQPVSEVEACEIKAKLCYADSENPAECDAVLKYCATLATAPKPPPPASSELESCRLKYKECYAYDNDPKLCESVAEKCKSLEVGDLQ